MAAEGRLSDLPENLKSARADKHPAPVADPRGKRGADLGRSAPYPGRIGFMLGAACRRFARGAHIRCGISTPPTARHGCQTQRTAGAHDPAPRSRARAGRALPLPDDGPICRNTRAKPCLMRSNGRPISGAFTKREAGRLDPKESRPTFFATHGHMVYAQTKDFGGAARSRRWQKGIWQQRYRKIAPGGISAAGYAAEVADSRLLGERCRAQIEPHASGQGCA